jgi:hypothetical protein
LSVAEIWSNLSPLQAELDVANDGLLLMKAEIAQLRASLKVRAVQSDRICTHRKDSEPFATLPYLHLAGLWSKHPEFLPVLVVASCTILLCAWAIFPDFICPFR